jgi:hypothetical protein
MIGPNGMRARWAGIVMMVLAGCRGGEDGHPARQTGRDSAMIASADSTGGSATPLTAAQRQKEAARVLQRQLQRELFNARDTGFIGGVRNCDEGGEEEAPPGLVLVRAALADKPVVSAESPNQATVRAILTSVASTKHHEGGDPEDIDVDVGVRVDTVDFFTEKDDAGYAICYTHLFLHRGALGWAVVKKWRPPNGSWQMVSRLADSLTASATALRPPVAPARRRMHRGR